MAVKYAIDNFITDQCDLFSSSEHSIYVVENLYNIRPSKPFRTTGVGETSGASPEYVCVDLLSAKSPNFCALFNVNFELGQSGDMLELQAADEPCSGQSGAGDWGSPDYTLDLSGELISDFKNLYGKPSAGTAYEYWRIAMIDAGNSDGYLEIGDWFLGTLEGFTKAYLQPGRADGPEFYGAFNMTDYGQIWSYHYSEAESFKLVIQNIGSTEQVNELKLFLQRVRRNNGKFVIVPDDDLKFCYYVYLRNMSDFGQQLAKGKQSKEEFYAWNLDLRTLTEGVSLIG
jgi:hypothetical protein